MKFSLTFISFIFSIVCYCQYNNQKIIDSLMQEIPLAKNDTVKARIYIRLEAEFRSSDPKGALPFALKSLAIVKKMKWSKGLAVCYNEIGNNYNDRGMHDLSLANFMKSLKYSQQVPIVRVATFSNISNLYLKQKNYNLVLKYNNEALKIATKENFLEPKASAFQKFGFLYEKDNEWDKAQQEFKKSLAIYRQTGNKYKEANALMNLGDVTQNTSQKIEFYINAKNILDTINPEDLLSVSNALSLATAYIDLFKKENNSQFLRKAEQLLNESILHSKKSEVIENLMDAYSQMGNLKKHQRKFEEALFYETESNRLNDSVFSQENKNKIATLENQKEIALRDKQILINKSTLKAKEKQKWFLLFGIAFLAIIGGLLFYQNKNRQKTNKKLETLNQNLENANKTKLRLLSILNHDLRSPVNSFIHYIQFQKENPKVLDEATKSRIENQTLSSAKNLLHSMEDILLWTKDQMDSFEPEFSNVLVSSLFTDTQNHFSSEQNINLKFECPQHLEIFTDKNYLKTIIRNLTGNAIKALSRDCAREEKSATVNWKAWQEKNYTYLSISDNGNGATDEDFSALYDDSLVGGTQSGLGLHLIRDLAKIINCKISVESQVDIGTIFELKMQ